ncbi:MAG: PKD domain-containing protein [Candidatus Omnitrophota bacterium]|jgi:PKD repeat protein/pimeloyl-ACP methyl ester carboxylesterase
MKPVLYLTALLFCVIFSEAAFSLDESGNPAAITIDSTKGAKINIYCYENTSANHRERPVLLVHGFNSKGSVWRNGDAKKDYVENLRKHGYDIIVVDMRGNPVDTDGDHKVDVAVVGSSWGYGITDLGDDVGMALEKGMDYLNKNLPDRNYIKADVITHSTGALAVTSYSRSIGLVSYRDNIDTLIELAPPNNGATGLAANIKNIMGIIPSVFTQTVAAYEYALEVADNKIWIPGSRMESENLRKELLPDSMLMKSIEDLGPDKRIKTFIAIGNEDWVVGDWSPVIRKRDDIGYEYFLGMDHFNFCGSETVLAVILDKLEKSEASDFFNKFKPYKKKQLAFLSGPGIDHPDDTFDTVDFAKGVDISPAGLFDLYFRIAARKNKTYLLKCWEILSDFKSAQSEISAGGDINTIIDRWDEELELKNKLLHDCYLYASREYLECPDIAVLANGYYNEMRKLIIEKVGEPVRVVDHSFESYIIDEQKIMVIPTGGLSGLSHSAIFKNKLSEYVKNGGMLICLTQQYGYDFNALPGGKISAYGWQEDASCHTKAAYIEDFHQILSAQDEFYPDIKLDGYFVDYPEGSKILLRRSKNQMPAMLMYDYGKGIVIAASVYTDWGYLNGQASLGEINLIRDILRWAKSGKSLPEYKIGEDFESPLPTNAGFNKIEIILKSPEGEILERKVSTESVYRLDTALEKPGIYSVDYILYDPDSKAIRPQAEGFYFSFSRPPSALPQNPDFTFNVTSDTENYIIGNPAVFTFHIRNNTTDNETIRFKANLPHHKINFNDIVTVPANDAISFDKEITARSTDLLSAYFYSSQNIFIGKAERGINVFEPGVEIDMSSDEEQYTPGKEAALNIDMENKMDLDLDISVVLGVTDMNNNQIYYNFSEIRLSGHGFTSWPQNFMIPEDALRGTYRAKLSVFSNSKIIGCKTIFFEIPGLPADGGIDIDSYIIPGTNIDLSIDMENNYPKNQAIPVEIKMINKGSGAEKGHIDLEIFQDTDTWDLSGIIKDDKGILIKGASINGIFANKDGEYRLKNLNKGPYTVNIKAQGFDTVSKEMDIIPGNNVLDVILESSKYGRLTGVIENCVGSSVALVPIAAAGSEALARYSVVSSDSLFKFEHLPVGTYLLTASPGNISENIQINEGENAFNAMMDSAIYEDLEEIEANNAFADANEAVLNSRIQGKIYPAADEDFFKFDIIEKGILYIKMREVPQGLRPSIKIYDPSVVGRIVSQKGGAANEKIILETEFDKTGMYYLLVKDWYGNISSPDNYSLDLNFIKTPDEYEPNETRESATLVDFGKNYFATVAVKADSDFYKLSIPDAGKITVYLSDVPANIRPYIKLYRDSGQCIDIKGGAAGENVTLEFEAASPSNYYVQVYDRYNSESSVSRYKFLALYVPGDEYSGDNTIYFEKHEEVPSIEGETGISLEIPAIAEKGKYYVKTLFGSIVSQETAGLVRAFYVGEKPAPASFKISYSGDVNPSFNAGDNAVLIFKITNEGGSKGVCSVNFKFRDLINETRQESLEPGESKDMMFNFLIPADMEETGCEAEYEVGNEIHKLNFNIIGLGINVEAEIEDNIFKLRVSNLSLARGVKLMAETRCGNFEKKIDFILDEEEELEFNIPGLYDNDKVYYGIYFESGRSLHLNSYLISGEEKPEGPLIKIIKAGCDKDIYEDGENILLNWEIESDGARPVTLSVDLINPDSGAARVIEEEISLNEGTNKVTREISTALNQSGIYRLIYEFSDIGSGSIFFDVGQKEEPKKNHEPILLKIGEKEAFSGDNLEFFIEAMDIDGDMLIYSSEKLPSGAGFDPWTRRFYWKPVESQAGDHFVVFAVSDGKARASETVKITITSPVNLPPEISVIAEPVNGIAPLEVHFNSYPINQYIKIAKYEWDFDGKGVYDFSSAESGEAVFIYTGEGSFPASLRVTDRNGITNTYAVTINVDKNPDAPDVYLSASPLKSTAPCKVFFKGGAFCPQGISRYDWDFDGDGVFDVGSTTEEVVKTYSLPGKYDAELKVISADGLTGSEKVLIEMDDPKIFSVLYSMRPVAGNVPVEVSFDAIVNSSAPIRKYQWDFEGDGLFDYVSMDSGTIKHTYCEPGAYAPLLRVTDSNNLSCQDKKEIKLGVLDPEEIHKGKVIVDTGKGQSPLAVAFSLETRDIINDAEYLWDFENDGALDLVTITPQAEFTYNKPGVYTAKLMTRTKDGILMSCFKTVYSMNEKGGEEKPVDSRDNNVSRNKIKRIELSDRTSLLLPADILEEDDVIGIRKVEPSPPKQDISEGKPLIECREYKFENRKEALDKEMTITIPYNDTDEDGIVDDSGIDELTLDAYWYDESEEEWKILSDVLLFPKENIVTIKTNHFTVFGIAGVEKEKENIGSGDDASDETKCFIATAVFDSPSAREVIALRAFRDTYLLKSKVGQELVYLYYNFSSPIADYIKHRPLLKAFLRCHLKLLVSFIQSIL